MHTESVVPTRKAWPAGLPHRCLHAAPAAMQCDGVAGWVPASYETGCGDTECNTIGCTKHGRKETERETVA